MFKRLTAAIALIVLSGVCGVGAHPPALAHQPPAPAAASTGLRERLTAQTGQAYLRARFDAMRLDHESRESLITEMRAGSGAEQVVAEALRVRAEQNALATEFDGRVVEGLRNAWEDQDGRTRVYIHVSPDSRSELALALEHALKRTDLPPAARWTVIEAMGESPAGGTGVRAGLLTLLPQAHAPRMVILNALAKVTIDAGDHEVLTAIEREYRDLRTASALDPSPVRPVPFMLRSCGGQEALAVITRLMDFERDLLKARGFAPWDDEAARDRWEQVQQEKSKEEARKLPVPEELEHRYAAARASILLRRHWLALDRARTALEARNGGALVGVWIRGLYIASMDDSETVGLIFAVDRPPDPSDPAAVSAMLAEAPIVAGFRSAREAWAEAGRLAGDEPGRLSWVMATYARVYPASPPDDVWCFRHAAPPLKDNLPVPRDDAGPIGEPDSGLTDWDTHIAVLPPPLRQRGVAIAVALPLHNSLPSTWHRDLSFSIFVSWDDLENRIPEKQNMPGLRSWDHGEVVYVAWPERARFFDPETDAWPLLP